MFRSTMVFVTGLWILGEAVLLATVAWCQVQVLQEYLEVETLAEALALAEAVADCAWVVLVGVASLGAVVARVGSWLGFGAPQWAVGQPAANTQPSLDLDLSVGTDNEDLAVFAADICEFGFQDVSLLSDLGGLGLLGAGVGVLVAGRRFSAWWAR